MSHSRSLCDSVVRATECVANVALAAILVLALSPVFAEPASAQSYTLTLLYSFTGSPDGQWPLGIVLDSQGNLYGSTQYGGLPSCGPVQRPLISCGTVFKLDTSGQETVLHRFTFGNGDGMVPEGSVMRDSAGNLYGTTYYGGDPRCFPGGEYYGCGMVFKLDPNGRETVLHEFEGVGQGDGAAPAARLVQDGFGNLYGTTSNGGDAHAFPITANRAAGRCSRLIQPVTKQCSIDSPARPLTAKFPPASSSTHMALCTARQLLAAGMTSEPCSGWTPVATKPYFTASEALQLVTAQ